jgi:hypothetical protein
MIGHGIILLFVKRWRWVAEGIYRVTAYGHTNVDAVTGAIVISMALKSYRRRIVEQ